MQKSGAYAYIYPQSNPFSPLIVGAVVIFGSILLATSIKAQFSWVSVASAVILLLITIVMLAFRCTFQVSADRTALIQTQSLFSIVLARREILLHCKNVLLQSDARLDDERELRGYFIVKLVGPRQIIFVEESTNPEHARKTAADFAEALNLTIIEEKIHPYTFQHRLETAANQPESSQDDEPVESASIATHDAIPALIATDAFILVSLCLFLGGSVVTTYGIAAVAYFLIASVITFVWSLTIIYRKPELPFWAQALFGLNATPFAILFAPITLGASVLLLLSVFFDDRIRRAWPHFTVFAATSCFLLLIVALFCMR